MKNDDMYTSNTGAPFKADRSTRSEKLLKKKTKQCKAKQSSPQSPMKLHEPARILAKPMKTRRWE
jgi:hypothetical protein